MKGYIHSIESFGTVDGPGVRLVVFVKGCPMRCLYCHNPDTWTMDGAQEMEAGEIIRQFNSARGFYRNGGITVSGGEPLLQMEFLTELFSLAKAENIHTCLDTCGITFRPQDPVSMERLNALLDLTDLILLDIKHIDPKASGALRPAKRSHPGFRQIFERDGKTGVDPPCGCPRHHHGPSLAVRDGALYRHFKKCEGAGRSTLPRHGKGQI